MEFCTETFVFLCRDSRRKSSLSLKHFFLLNSSKIRFVNVFLHLNALAGEWLNYSIAQFHYYRCQKLKMFTLYWSTERVGVEGEGRLTGEVISLQSFPSSACNECKLLYLNHELNIRRGRLMQNCSGLLLWSRGSF